MADTHSGMAAAAVKQMHTMSDDGSGCAHDDHGPESHTETRGRTEDTIGDCEDTSVEHQAKRRRRATPPAIPTDTRLCDRCDLPVGGHQSDAVTDSGEFKQRKVRTPPISSKESPHGLRDDGDGSAVDVEPAGAELEGASNATEMCGSPGQEPNLYHVLGATESSTPEQLIAEFRERAFLLHPDRNKGDPTASTKFQTLNEAYVSAQLNCEGYVR